MSTSRKLFFLIGIPVLGVFAWWILGLLEGSPPGWLKALALVWLAVALFRLLRYLGRLLLWRVSGRLAFSYFLLGVVPVPLVALLVGVGLYVLAGFFLGHLYRTATVSLQSDLHLMARSELDRMLGRQGETYAPVEASFAYFKDGSRLAGDPSVPDQWREFWPLPGSGPSLAGVTFFADADTGEPTLVGGARAGSLAVLARFDGDLNAELSRRSGIWAELSDADRVRERERWTLVLANREYPLEALLRPTAPREEIQRFFFPGEGEPGRFDRPSLVWLELTRPFLDLETGGAADEYVSATLTSSLNAVALELIPTSAEVGFWVYLIFLGVFLVTFNLYVLAALMALMMIFGLSRAVNRLTEATRRVQQGDFSARIKVFRRDQVGALQESFNAMAGNLETLVAETAEKELYERELEIARQMQHGLLPDTLKAPAPLRFATYFQPSRAIGGDYYDLLTLADGRCAVVIADVSGHGLPAGLRMAMVKSAFELLCEESSDPIHILRRLHHLLLERLQNRDRRRSFVTATLAAIDPESGALELVNAGHTPTYRLRRGEVEEIELPGPPLGALRPNYPRRELRIEEGDVWVWLSDGIIEATNREGRVFGYDRIVEVIRSCADGTERVGPEAVKRAILSALREHLGEAAVDDDLTLVVMGS